MAFFSLFNNGTRYYPIPVKSGIRTIEIKHLHDHRSIRSFRKRLHRCQVSSPIDLFPLLSFYPSSECAGQKSKSLAKLTGRIGEELSRFHCNKGFKNINLIVCGSKLQISNHSVQLRFGFLSLTCYSSLFLSVYFSKFYL